MIRRLKFKSFFSVFSLGLLASACKPSSSSGCLSGSSKVLDLAPTSRFVQGGYLRQGDKLCTTTFDIVDVQPEKIILKGYSARHCRFESASVNSDNFVSLYFDRTATRSEGFVVDIPVRESFSMRAKQTMREVAALQVPLAVEWVNDALKVPVHLDPWGEQKFSGIFSNVCNNFDLFEPIPDPQNKLSHSCWTALDLGVFDLEIQKSAVKEKDFTFLSRELKKKKDEQSAYLSTRTQLAALKEKYQKDLSGSLGLLRLRNYAQLGYLLNMDWCRISGNSTVDAQSLCRIQPKLIEIVGRSLLETDESGRQVNIFDKLAAFAQASLGYPGLPYAELLAGKRLMRDTETTTADDALFLAKGYSADMNMLYKDKTAILFQSLHSTLKELSTGSGAARILSSMVVGTNFTTTSQSGGSQLRYGQFPLLKLSDRPDGIQLVPDGPGQNAETGVDLYLSRYGLFRMAVAKESEVVSFLPTDSGSLVTIQGLIPLMVLNTVNDKPTSGGASILALPEAGEEVMPSARPVSVGRSPSKASPQSAESTGSAKIRSGQTVASSVCR